MSGQHSPLGGSNSHRWLHCTPSARLEEKIAYTAGEAAKEGTAAHALLEWKLKRRLGLPAKDNRPASQYDCAEMDGHTEDCADYIAEQVATARTTLEYPTICIEQKVSFTRWVPMGFGTADFVMVTDGVLYILDFKYGAGIVVDANENTQLMLYALGTLTMFDGIYDIERVVMTIYQPRRENISVYEMTADELLRWAEDTLKPIAALAYAGKGDFVPGEHCRFCRAAMTCRVRADEQLSLAKDEFRFPPQLSDDEISKILPRLDGLIDWASDMKEYALRSAVGGKAWPGYKLVEGRSNRRYADDAKVTNAAIAAGYSDIYKQTLLPVTDMERLLGKKRFSDILGTLIIKPPGKPSLVPDTDKRPTLDRTSAADDFAD
ncbi:hypothetical protein AGMMS49992_19260 [Clostridia bacterium]|nr:hypothetical protein AGMMS49992_19260 [Clostridia bacterium]